MKNVPLDLGWKRKDVKLEAEWEEQERDRQGDEAGLESRYNGGKDRSARRLGRLPESRNPGPRACRVTSWENKSIPTTFTQYYIVFIL